MLKKIMLASLILTAGLLVASQNTYAFPSSGIAYYNVPGNWSATVNWEVYAPGDTNSHIAADSDWHYFYYITRTDQNAAQTLKLFTIGNPGAAPIDLTGNIDRGAGTPAPSDIEVYPDVMYYEFKSDTIGIGESTDWLYFTSPTPPAWVSGGLQNGGGNNYQPVPGPAPEPASVALLGLGLIGMAGRAIRRRFTA